MAHAHKKHPPTQSHAAPPESPSFLPRNMGVLDRGIRVGLALLIGLLFGLGELRGTVGTVFDNDDNQPSVFLRLLPEPDAAPLARFPLSLRGIVGRLRQDLTSAVGTCPLYLPFGIDTRLKGGRR